MTGNQRHCSQLVQVRVWDSDTDLAGNKKSTVNLLVAAPTQHPLAAMHALLLWTPAHRAGQIEASCSQQILPCLL